MRVNSKHRNVGFLALTVRRPSVLVSPDPEHQVQFGNSRPTPVYALAKIHPESVSSDRSNHNVIRPMIPTLRAHWHAIGQTLR